MSNVSYVISGQVRDSDTTAFKALAKDAIDACSAREPDTLTFEWHVAEDGATFACIETFKDDAAFAHHVKNMSESGILEKFTKVVLIERVHTFSPVSEASREILTGFGATFMEKAAGI